MSKDLKKSKGVSLAIFSSRILGLVREQIFAIYFGAGLVKDAFDVAFRIPNLLRDLFAEGAMSAAFVSRFSAIKASESEQSAFELACKVITFLSLVVGAIVLLSIVFCEELVQLFAGGFADRLDVSSTRLNATQLTTCMIKLMFPFLWLVSIASVFTGILNTYRRFGLPALAPALFNVGTICAGGLAAYIFHFNNLEPIFGMALGTVMGGIFQWLLLLPQLRKVSFKFRPDFKFNHPHLKQVLVMMIPAVIGQSAFQVNLIITTRYAADLGAGSISWLGYAYRFMQLPIGVFSVAIAIVALPNLAELISLKRFPEFKNSLTESLKLCLFFTIPASIGLYILAEPIVHCIYGYGKFSIGNHTYNTAGALKYYVLGLAAWSVVKILSPAYYANNKTWIPMCGSFFAIAVNAILCYYFIYQNRIFPEHPHFALALATTIAAFVNAIILYLFTNKFEWKLDLLSMTPFFFKLGIASGVLGFVSYFLKQGLFTDLANSNPWLNAGLLGLVIGIAFISFMITAKTLKLSQVELVFGKLLTRFKK